MSTIHGEIPMEAYLQRDPVIYIALHNVNVGDTSFLQLCLQGSLGSRESNDGVSGVLGKIFEEGIL
jgi:hypothetical protein